MSATQLELETIVSLPFMENSYVAWLAGRSDCVVVDPGFEPEKIIRCLEARSLTPAALLITHGHSDHIAGNGRLKQRYPDCPIVIGRHDAPKLEDPRLNLSGMVGAKLVSPPADVLVDEGDVYSAAGFDLAVYEIPGHSIGHVVYVWLAGAPPVVFGGDVLFRGNVGRTDFPDGNFELLAEGIRTKLYTLPDETRLLSGHGKETTIGQEKRSNPYVPGQ